MDESRPPDVGDVIKRLWPVNWGHTLEDVKRMLDAHPSTLPIGSEPIGSLPKPLYVEEILARFWQANCEEGWGFTLEDVGRLLDNAPALPSCESKLAVISLRVRFGEGAEGVNITFDAHAKRIRKVFGIGGFEGFYRSDGKFLLRAGTHTHTPVVEWVKVDLGANRTRLSVASVREQRVLADELLVVAWMFPELIRAIDHKKVPGFFAAGYSLVYHGHTNIGEPTFLVCHPCFSRDSRVSLGSRGDVNDGSQFSVPILME